MRDIFNPIYWVSILAEGLLNAGYFLIPYIWFSYWQERLLNAGYFFPLLGLHTGRKDC